MSLVVTTAVALIVATSALAAEVGQSAAPGSPKRMYHGHGVYDYYARSSYPEHLLGNVLAYHVKPAQEGLRAGDWTKVENNVDFILNYFPNHPEGLMLALRYAAKSGNKRFALDHIKRALDINPDIGWTHVVYGVYLHREKELKKAEEQYRKAIALNDRLAEAYYNLGLVLLDEGRVDDAKAPARKAYDLGYPLPGLRMRLVDAGAWPKQTHAPKDKQ